MKSEGGYDFKDIGWMETTELFTAATARPGQGGATKPDACGQWNRMGGLGPETAGLGSAGGGSAGRQMPLNV